MPARSALVTAAVTAGVYVGAAKLGFTMAFTAAQVTLVWPPTGLALAALLLYGRAAWPGVLIGAFLANATAHEQLPVAACIAIGNSQWRERDRNQLHRCAARVQHLRQRFRHWCRRDGHAKRCGFCEHDRRQFG